jgi:NhaA family Na+:H+ antiporter
LAGDEVKATIREFVKLESASGITLMLAALLAMIVANSPLQHWYALLLDVPVEVRIGALQIAKPLILWINDGLMAVFFFLVGLELKREVLEGELSRPANVLLPALGAVGGVVVPAGIYLLLNHDDTTAMNGWAIPAATDLAFALGILMLLGNRVPASLKIFLVSLAIFDDLAAVLIIAIFYTSDLSATAMLVAGTCLFVLGIMSWRGVSSISPYLWVGLIMWVAVLKSGVHATLAGVVLAAFIPMRDKNEPENSPLGELEDDLHYLVAFFILPVFAFANSGVSLQGIGIDQMLHPVPLGIAAGLFLGKQAGVFLFCWLAIRLGIARMPDGANWASLYGVSVLCGVGFTMSLFVASLAFESSGTDMHTVFDERMGIIAGSLASGILGYLVLRRYLPKASADD